MSLPRHQLHPQKSTPPLHRKTCPRMTFDLADLAPQAPRFHTPAETREAIRNACAAHPDFAAFHHLGESEEGRPLYGVTLGTGAQRVSLIAGNHADEPVGPETLHAFVLEGLAQREELSDLFERFRFAIVPHTNPDGAARNRAWIERWPDAEAYLQHAVREAPGRDLEFGFPAMRRENEAVSDFLRRHAPFVLHMSLHGMGFSEGAQLLIERHWTFRTQPLRDGFAEAVRADGLRLHDHNRKGEKGFFYVEPGFTTTPEGAAMRAFFRAKGDEEMAWKFHDSSMEFAKNLGGDPLCLVTELPLFVIGAAVKSAPGVPAAYLRLKERLPEWRLRLERGRSLGEEMEAFGLRPLPLQMAMRLQLRALALGLEAVRRL